MFIHSCILRSSFYWFLLLFCNICRHEASHTHASQIGMFTYIRFFNCRIFPFAFFTYWLCLSQQFRNHLMQHLPQFIRPHFPVNTTHFQFSVGQGRHSNRILKGLHKGPGDTVVTRHPVYCQQKDVSNPQMPSHVCQKPILLYSQLCQYRPVYLCLSKVLLNVILHLSDSTKTSFIWHSH